MMKKLFMVFVVSIMTVSFLFAGNVSAQEGTDEKKLKGTHDVGVRAKSVAAPEGKEPVPGGTLRIIVGRLEPNVLGYPPKTGGRATFFIHPVIENLVMYNEKLELTGMLAESWEVDREAKTVTFKIRKGVKFHDGTEMDAEAAAWNIQLMKDTSSFFEYTRINSIEVVDKYTMRFNLKVVSNTLLHSMTYGSKMVSPTAFKKNGGKDWAISHPVGTGPYRFKEFQRGAKLAYTRFDDYWRGKPYLDGIEFRMVKDPTVCMATMKAGEADLWVLADLKEALELEKEGFTTRYCQGSVEGMWPSSREKESIFKNKRIRQAVEYAIDREAITQAVAYSSPAVLPAYQRPFPGDPGYREGYGRRYDPKKAKALLKDAGYPNGFNTKLYVSQISTRQKISATAVQSYLAAVGIKASIEFVAPSAYFGKRLRGWKDGFYFAGDPRDAWPPAALAVHLPNRPEGAPAWNYSVGVTEPMKVMYKEMLAAPSNEDQLEVFKKFVHYVDDESTYLYLTYWPDAAVIAPNVHTTWIRYSTKVWEVHMDWIEQQ